MHLCAHRAYFLEYVNMACVKADVASEEWGCLVPLPQDGRDGSEVACGDTSFLIETIHINKTPFTIGRDVAGVTYASNNPAISQTHCVLMREQVTETASKGVETLRVPHWRMTLKDKSSNGVYINDARVGKDNSVALKDGDKVHLGR